MTSTERPGGVGRIGHHTVARIGYGAMQLGVTVGPDEAVAVLHRAFDLGVDHVDTASFYAGGEVNRRLGRVLASRREELVIVSKVGAAHLTAGAVPMRAAQKPAELRAAVEDDLRQLGLDCVPVVNLRRLDLGPGLRAEGDQIVSLDDQLAEMIALRDEGKVGAIGISNVPPEIMRKALGAGIVCVQNSYNVLNRSQEEALQLCMAEDIAWVPFFPLGSSYPGFAKVSDDATVRDVAEKHEATTAQIGLAWLLAHSPNTLLIPGTRSVAHLEQNVRAGDVFLDADDMARLDGVGSFSDDGDGLDRYLGG